MAHRTARLNQFGRQLLTDRVLTEGWTVATAAFEALLTATTNPAAMRSGIVDGGGCRFTAD